MILGRYYLFIKTFSFKLLNVTFVSSSLSCVLKSLNITLFPNLFSVDKFIFLLSISKFHLCIAVSISNNLSILHHVSPTQNHSMTSIQIRYCSIQLQKILSDLKAVIFLYAVRYKYMPWVHRIYKGG